MKLVYQIAYRLGCKCGFYSVYGPKLDKDILDILLENPLLRVLSDRIMAFVSFIKVSEILNKKYISKPE